MFDLDRLLHKVNDAIPGVASKLLLVAHEALETERAIQGAVQEEEVGGVVAQVAVEVIGLIPGRERSDRLVVELALEGPPQHLEVEPVLVVPDPSQEASVEAAMGLAEEPRADLRRARPYQSASPRSRCQIRPPGSELRLVETSVALVALGYERPRRRGLMREVFYSYYLSLG